MSEQQWFYRCWNGPEIGPLTLAQLKAAALSGELGPYNEGKEIRRADETEWKRVSRSLAALGENADRHRREYEQALEAMDVSWYPCWELETGMSDDIMPLDWPTRWAECGGRFYAGRMIAPKSDGIWQQIGNSTRYADGLDVPHFPFVMSAVSAYPVRREECLRLGVMTEAEVRGQESRAPDYAEYCAEMKEVAARFKPGELETIRAGLQTEIEASKVRLKAIGYDLETGRYDDATRAKMDADRAEARQREVAEKDRAFCNMKEVQRRLPLLKENYSATVAAELLILLTEAVEGGHIRRYPKWLGQAYRFTGEILELIGELTQAVEYYGCALKADPKAGVAQRMKALQAKLGTTGV